MWAFVLPDSTSQEVIFKQQIGVSTVPCDGNEKIRHVAVPLSNFRCITAENIQNLTKVFDGAGRDERKASLGTVVLAIRDCDADIETCNEDLDSISISTHEPIPGKGMNGRSCPNRFLLQGAENPVIPNSWITADGRKFPSMSVLGRLKACDD